MFLLEFWIYVKLEKTVLLKGQNEYQKGCVLLCRLLALLVLLVVLIV